MNEKDVNVAAYFDCKKPADTYSMTYFFIDLKEREYTQ